jgi:hypothetical protein
MPDPPKRRDFLGLTALWGVVIAMGTALAGVMRLPKPAVQPGPLRVFKLGESSWATKTRLVLRTLCVMISSSSGAIDRRSMTSIDLPRPSNCRAASSAK